MIRLFFRAAGRTARGVGGLLWIALGGLAQTSTPADAAPISSPLLVVATPPEPGRGQVSLELEYGFRSSAQVFGVDGRALPSDPSAVWSVHELRLEAAYGLTRRTSASVVLPILAPTLQNERLEAPLSNPFPMPGDVTFALHTRLLERSRPYRSVTLELRAQAPTGLEAAGDPGTTLLTGTGVPAFGAGLRVKRQLDWAALELRVGYTGYVSQVVAYADALYTSSTGDTAQGDARFHPGNQTDLTLALQLEPFRWMWLQLSVHGAYQQTYGLGTTSRVLFPSLDLEPLLNSEGLFADAGGTLTVPFSRRLELAVSGRYRFLGRTLPELAALGLEAFSPPPGWSGGLALRVRR